MHESCPYRSMPTVVCLLVGLVLAAAVAAAPADWPQFRGPSRDGRSAETGLATDWSASGPPVVWRAPLGGGFSGLSVSGGRVVTLFTSGRDEILAAFDSGTGHEIWRRRLDAAYTNSFGSGPRSTPTIDGEVVYALGARGALVAVDAATGKRLWNRDLKIDFGARIPEWGVAMSPLVEGRLLLLDVGGRADHSIVALDKTDGSLVWHAESDIAGYSSPIVIDAAGHRQAVFMTGNGAVGLDVASGRRLWRVPWKTRYDVNAATPIFVAPDRIYLSSGYGVGAALFRLRPGGDVVTVEELWRTRRMKNQFSSAVVVGDAIYGFDETILKSLRLSSGEENWKARGFGHGSLFFADGKLVVLGEQGQLALVDATPTTFEVLAETRLFSAKAWTVPTLSDGRLYVRNERELIALDLTGRPAD